MRPASTHDNGQRGDKLASQAQLRTTTTSRTANSKTARTKMRRQQQTLLAASLLCYLALATLAVQQVFTLNPVLDIKGTFPYLINKTTGSVIEPRNYMDFENIYTPNEAYRRKQTAQGKVYHLIKAFDFANYFQSDYWHYSSEQDLKLSAYPVANRTKCAQHLDWLEARLNSSGALFKSGQQHVNLMNYVDSFGKPESSTYLGHPYWLGSHYQCSRVSIEQAQFEEEECRSSASSASELAKCAINPSPAATRATKTTAETIKTRYCIGKARDADWPSELEDNYKPQISIKVGLCLPETCETLSFGQHKAQLERLMRFSLPDYLKGRTNLADLYCLPDARSPIRAVSLSGRVYLAICFAWLLLLFVASSIYSSYKRHQRDLKNIMLAEQVLREHHHVSLPDDIHSKSSSHRSSSSSLSNWLNGRLLTIRILQALSISENMREFKAPPPMLREPGATETLRINLNAMDSIKCLCCVLVILGHIVFIHMQHLSNILYTIELSNEIYPRFLMAFFNFVDTFFIISGMLTAYFIFKRFNKETFANPLVWIYISLLRLLRLSPVYLLVFWFVKTVAIHLSDGPIWDYGTDKNSIMGLCINDHWWKSILYLGNVGTMQPHCILPAWSIIVDSQYSLVMPPVLFLILKHKKLGYLSLLIAVIISTTNMSYQLATQTAVKTTDMAKIRLHVYPLISRFAAEFYNTAWNRIGPVAIGILGGHMLYLYDIGTLRRWPWFMRGTTFKFVLFLHLFILLIPTIGRLTDNPELPPTSETDMFIFVLSNATIKPLWSLINTIFLLRLVTDLRLSSRAARLMSHNIWHSLGKLCFASYLIHYEVILILLKSRREGLVAPNWTNVAREFSLAFLISTGLSYLIYILFEAPINKLVTLAMAKPKSKS